MPERLNAIAELILFYLILPIVGIFSFVLALSSESIARIGYAITTVMYASFSVVIWLKKVDYGSKILNTIKIDEAPIQITRLLSETTNRGVLINQLIIKTLAEKRGISQTDLHRELPISADMAPSKERVRQYTLILEKEGIVKDIASELGEGKKRVYLLTNRGQWCLKAINKYYPTYYVTFLIRSILKTRLRSKLPPFDSVESEEHYGKTT